MKRIKLGEVLDVKRGASLAGEFYSERGEKIRLTLGNFKYPGGGFKQNTSKKDIYFNGPVKPEFILNKGDIITPLTEQVAGLLGETARVPEGNLYIQSGDIGLVIPDERLLDKDFAYYLVSSPLVKKQLDAAAQQTKIRHTSPDAIKDCVSYIPELMEQKKIAKLLDAINDKVTNNNAIAVELESMAKDLYDYWFVQFDFPDENGKPYKSSGGKMVWNDELKREIPEGWENRIVSDLGTVVTGGTPSTGCAEYFAKSKSGHAWATPKDLSNLNGRYFYHGEADITDAGLKNSAGNIMPKGSVLFTTRAPIGYIAITANEACTNQGFKSIIPAKKFGTEFVFQTLKMLTPQMQRVGVGSTFKEVSKDVFSHQSIVIPSVNLLKKYAALTLDIAEKIRNTQEENVELTSLRDFLLPMLMNGQVKVKGA